MNKLVLIGNGFDLAHGLKTKYTDFLLWYVNKAFEDLKLNSQYNDDLIRLRKNKEILVTTKPFLTVQEFLNTMESYSEFGLKFNHPFFENLIRTNHKNNWVDIEAHYYAELIKIYKKTEKFDHLWRLSDIEDEVDKLNKCFELVKEQLIEHLTEVDKGLKQKNEEINKHISILIRSAKGEYEAYLRSVAPVSSSGQIHFLNFNYTSTIEEYVDKNDTKDFCKINYIHGKLGDKNNPIIFGYGDEMDSYFEKIERLNSNKFLKNIKSFGYFRTGNYQNFSSLINSQGGLFEVHVMGHSCGLSDRILLNSIFEHPNCASIKIYYHQKSEIDNDFFEKTQEISRHFTAKGKEKMRTTIVSFQDSKPLTSFTKA